MLGTYSVKTLTVAGDNGPSYCVALNTSYLNLLKYFSGSVISSVLDHLVKLNQYPIVRATGTLMTH